MSNYTFDEGASTALSGIIPGLTLGAGTASGVLSDLETDGSGNAINSNNFSTVVAFVTGSTVSDLEAEILASAEYTLPVIRCDASNEGYTLSPRGYDGGANSITGFDLSADSTYLGQMNLASALLLNSGQPRLVFSSSGDTVSLAVYQGGSLVETLTYDHTGAGLTRDGSGIEFKRSSASPVARSWEDGRSAGDVTAPTITTGTVVESRAWTRPMQLDEVGVIHAVAVPASDTAYTNNSTDRAKIAAGQDQAGVAVPAGRSVSVNITSADTDFDISLSNIPTATDFVVYWYGEDDEGTPNESDIQSVTMDAAASGSTEDSNVIYETTVENLQSQTQFGLAQGPATDGQLNGNVIVLSHAGSDHDFAKFQVTGYDVAGGGAARLVTGALDASGYTIANGDRARVYASYTGVNVSKINNTELQGTGATGDNWRPVGQSATN